MWGKREEPRESKPVKPAEVPRAAETPRPVAAQPPSEPPSHTIAAPVSEAPRAAETPLPPAPVAALATAAPMGAISRITHSLSIHGQITGEEDLYIDGEVSGKIRIAGGKVTIGPNGRVDSDIESREIEVHGHAQGLLRAAERVFLGRTASASGDIVTHRISIEDGASFTGRVEVLRPEPVVELKKTEAIAARAASAGAAAASTPAVAPASTPAGPSPAMAGASSEEPPRAFIAAAAPEKREETQE
jgi:cytoskeletal protein CcmA (bactofilin family)